MNEDTLRPIFQPFGPLIEVAVIRDRNTGSHRGCAFVTYEARASGMSCIASLHDKVTLDPVRGAERGGGRDILMIGAPPSCS